MINKEFLLITLLAGSGISIFLRALSDSLNKVFGRFKRLKRFANILFVITIWLIMGGITAYYLIINRVLILRRYYPFTIGMGLLGVALLFVDERILSGIIGGISGALISIINNQIVNPVVSGIAGMLFGFISGYFIKRDLQRDRDSIDAKDIIFANEIGSISTGMFAGGLNTFFTNYLILKTDFLYDYSVFSRSILYLFILGLLLIIPSRISGILGYRIALLLEKIFDSLSKGVSFFLKINFILFSQRATICKECLSYNSPFGSKYENGRKCKNCGKDLKKINYDWLKENISKFIDGLKYKEGEEDRVKGCAWALDRLKDEKVNPIYRFKNSYPDLVCKNCFLKTELRGVEISNFNSYTYPVCRNCEDPLSLYPDIKKVIGVIGGDLNDFNVIGEKFYVNLWNNGKARNADIDILEIINSPKIENYDYVINSVYTTLYNDVSRDKDYFKKVTVIIKGNPPISEDVISMLKEKFKDVRYV